MKRIQSDFINNLGIGAFAFFSILEFCGLIEYIFRNILIINKTDSIMILWLPEIVSLIIFLVLIVWLINKFNNPTEINTRKVLIKLIGMFFGIITLQFLFTYFGTDYLMEKYPTEFDSYIDGRKGNYELQGYIAFIPILKYVIFGIILLSKKTVANNV
ncbi:hypothetical protein JAO71_12945 [Olleya sp. YSTF-M6]|uniref:Uncharacterized protein n=1 Tax=Olleya sediminilitoris TaxID=2795739 RepID=A0ABS1WNR2_9FLAO|nr:hypothetical protein [Olleya sediminilitoris]MBL7560708.1 hypothetical protein [Olleya sediminilitoris]